MVKTEETDDDEPAASAINDMYRLVPPPPSPTPSQQQGKSAGELVAEILIQQVQREAKRLSDNISIAISRAAPTTRDHQPSESLDRLC